MVELRRGTAFGTGLVLLLVMSGCTTSDNTTAPPGDLQKFDPIASFAAMATYAGPEARLVSLQAYFVRTDGTMDLEAEYHPHLGAEFVTRATPEDVKAQGAVAPGSGFSVGDALQTSLAVRAPQTRHVSSGSREWNEDHLGMERDPGSKASGREKFAEPPHCGFAQMWQKAIEQGAPADVVANIKYDSEGYTFEANGRDFRRRFGVDCTLLAK